MKGIYKLQYDEKYGVEAFVYHSTMKGYKHLPDVDLFNGWKSEHTISRNTIEMILMRESKL